LIHQIIWIIIKGLLSKYMVYKHKTAYQNKKTAGSYNDRFLKPTEKINHYLEARFLRKMIKNCGIINNALDVACGTGRLTFELINSGIENITGSDISEEMMEIARLTCLNDKINICFKKGDATQLPFKDNQFDLVISFRFLDHLPVMEKKKAIIEMIRVSSKYMVFTMANLNFWTKISRKIRKLFNKNYYEGNLIHETDVITLLEHYNVRIDKRKIKAPFVGMQIMYFCEKS